MKRLFFVLCLFSCLAAFSQEWATYQLYQIFTDGAARKMCQDCWDEKRGDDDPNRCKFFVSNNYVDYEWIEGKIRRASYKGTLNGYRIYKWVQPKFTPYGTHEAYILIDPISHEIAKTEYFGKDCEDCEYAGVNTCVYSLKKKHGCGWSGRNRKYDATEMRKMSGKCRGCNGSGKCQACTFFHGLDFIHIHLSKGYSNKCYVCDGTAKCQVCKGNGFN